jgi:hypothetical protein
LRQTLLHNLGIKITSLVLALAVYAHVYARAEQAVVLQLPVAIEKVPEGLAWRGDVPRRIAVRMRVRGVELIKLRAQPPRVVIPLEHAREGALQRAVTVGDVVLPPKSEATPVELVQPVVLTLHLEPLVRAVRPVSVPLRGRPQSGWVLSSPPRVEPETLTISGPASLVAPLDSVPTEALVLDHRGTGFETTLAVRPPAGMRARLERVSVRVDLEESSGVTLGPLAVGMPAGWPRGWGLEPESVLVTLSGPARALSELRLRDIRVRLLPGVAAVPDRPAPVEAIVSNGDRRRIRVERLDPPAVHLRRREDRR